MARRRLTAWEGQDSIADIVEGEFSTREGDVDLRPSVYAVTAEEHDTDTVTRVCTEHRANAGNPAPKKRSGVVDLGGIECPDQPDPQSGAPFSFCAARHRTMKFADAEAFVAALGAFLQAGRPVSTTGRGEMKAYAHRKLTAQDQEWLSFIETELGAKWKADLKL